MTERERSGTLEVASDMESEEPIRVARTRLLYDNSAPGIAVNLLAVGLLSAGLWQALDRATLIVWIGLHLVGAAIRTTLVVSYYRQGVEQRRQAFWFFFFYGSLLAAATVWGIGGWLFLSHVSLVHQTVIYIFLLGMAVGSAVIYSAHLPSTVVMCLVFMGPTTVEFLLSEESILHIVGLAGLLLFVMCARGTHRIGLLFGLSMKLSIELDEARREAETLARTDDLTGLDNRRQLYEQGNRMVEEAKRYGHPLSAMVLDIDRFKKINDRYGHAIGDLAIRRLATLIRGCCRSSDVAGRLGGDEFVVLLPQTDRSRAELLGERLRAQVEEMTIAADGDEIRFTCSIGLAEGDPADGLDSLIRQADDALYEAKKAGRNRVVAGDRCRDDGVPDCGNGVTLGEPSVVVASQHGKAV